VNEGGGGGDFKRVLTTGEAREPGTSDDTGLRRRRGMRQNERRGRDKPRSLEMRD